MRILKKTTKKKGIVRYKQLIENIIKQVEKMPAHDQTKQKLFIINRQKVSSQWIISTWEYDNSYDNQAMQSIVHIPSKKQSYNASRDNEDAVNNNSKEVGLPNSTDGSKKIQEDDQETDEAIKKYVVGNNGVRNQRGPNNNSKITSTIKSICTHKIQTDIIQKKINKKKELKKR